MPETATPIEIGAEFERLVVAPKDDAGRSLREMEPPLDKRVTIERITGS